MGEFSASAIGWDAVFLPIVGPRKSASICEIMRRRPRPHTRFKSLSELHDYVLEQDLAFAEAREVATGELARSIELRESLKAELVIDPAVADYHSDLEHTVQAMEGHGIPPVARPHARRLIEDLLPPI
jgi:hypothetical protein